MLSILNRLSPQIRKADFDKEAKMFLEKFCPEALLTPMAVPIIDIARKKMGLRIVERHLSEDLSVLGQMCFTNGIAVIYDKENDEFREVKARYGTMIIDPDTVKKRNEGCMNNTVAHECFHWHKHRDYHISVSVKENVKGVKRYCYSDKKPESTQKDWTDEDWMEWQANGVALRILLPCDMFKIMAEKTLDEYDYRWAVNNLASFFKVSKQAVKIRLEETGYSLY